MRDIIRSTVIFREDVPPLATVGRHTISDYDAEPVEDGGGLHVLVQRHVKHIVGGFRDDQASICVQLAIPSLFSPLYL